MNKEFEKIILRSTGAKELKLVETIQELWSGYGEILRYELTDSELDSIVVKNVRMPSGKNHPRGWNSDASHKRKIKSYKVETAWYKTYNQQCTEQCRTPKTYAITHQNDEVLIVLEDLDSSGFGYRRNSVSWNEIEATLSWLAYFHALFMGENPEKLWKNGTYWHLATRPDELKALNDIQLKKSAGKIDLLLSQTTYKSFVHGDAKLANFCFSEDGTKVAAVDFQYVGGGCGMKDVAYFVGSCLNESECDLHEEALLNTYFEKLTEALNKHKPNLDAKAVEDEWRQMYYLAWVDFHRFLKGWSPGHWKITSYSERLSKKIIASL